MHYDLGTVLEESLSSIVFVLRWIKHFIFLALKHLGYVLLPDGRIYFFLPVACWPSTLSWPAQHICSCYGQPVTEGHHLGSCLFFLLLDVTFPSTHICGCLRGRWAMGQYEDVTVISECQPLCSPAPLVSGFLSVIFGLPWGFQHGEYTPGMYAQPSLFREMNSYSFISPCEQLQCPGHSLNLGYPSHLQSFICLFFRVGLLMIPLS